METAFNVGHWADWASQRATGLQSQSERAWVTFAEETNSEDLAFFVDFDNAGVVGRIIFWSNGDYDVTVQQLDAAEPVQISGWPKPATDENFQEVFSRFVTLVRELR